MVALRLKQWLRRKKSRYQAATEQYIRRLHEAIDRETKERLIEPVETLDICLRDLDKIKGFTIKKADLANICQGDSITLTRCNKHIYVVAEGKVSQVNEADIRVELEKPLTNFDENCAEYQIIRTVKSPIIRTGALDRKSKVNYALRKFRKFSCSLPIHRSILGDFQDSANIKYSKARRVLLKGLNETKGVQSSAVEQSMRKRISLIEGVAGSGKTLIAAHLACSMSRLRKKKILLCSPMQTTVDRLAGMIENIDGVSVVKLPSAGDMISKRRHGSYTQAKCDGDTSKQLLLSAIKTTGCSIHDLVDEAIYTRSVNRLVRSYMGVMRRQRIRMTAEKMVRNSSPWLRKRMEHKIILRADVVCCTLEQAISSYLRGVNFDMLIIDDAQMASEIDCLMPMTVKGLKQVTLLSDMRKDIRLAKSISQVCEKEEIVANNNLKHISPHSLKGPIKKMRTRQRPAQKKKRIAEAPQVEESLEPGCLFERLISIGLAPVALKRQYRMLKRLAAFPAQHFYLSCLETDKESNAALELRSSPFSEDSFDWMPKKICGPSLFNVSGLGDETSTTVKTKQIVDLLLSKENIHPSDIGVINNVSALDIAGSSSLGVKVGTVEDFFGQDYDFIILPVSLGSVEATKPTGSKINYLVNDVALHIAITRARLGLFIVADLEKVEEKLLDYEFKPSICKSWQDLVKYYRDNELICE